MGKAIIDRLPAQRRLVLPLLVALLLGSSTTWAPAEASHDLPNEISPAAASNGDVTLVVWSDRRNDADYDIYAARISATGEVLDPDGLLVSGAPGSAFGAQVVWNGDNFFVVWNDDREQPGYDRDVFGARVTVEGDVLDPLGISISPPHQPSTAATVGWNGINHLVVWSYFDEGTGDDLVLAARVTSSGIVVDEKPFFIGYSSTSAKAVSSSGGSWLVSWLAPSGDLVARRVGPNGEPLEETPIVVADRDRGVMSVNSATNGLDYLLVWRGGEPFGADIFATRVTGGGVVLDPDGIAIASDENDEYSSDVGWNGERYEIVWTFAGAFRRIHDVYARTLDVTGALGPQVTVSAAEGDQWHPAVASVGGDTLVAWQDARSLQDYDIYGRYLDQTGNVASSEFAISTVGRTPRRSPRGVGFRLRRHLLAKGRVSSMVEQPACYGHVRGYVQRLRSGRWVRWDRFVTGADGNYRERVPDRRGRYRVLIPETKQDDLICERAVSRVRSHRH